VTSAIPGEQAAAASHAGSEAKVQSVLSALDVLDCFADCEELGVTQIARRLGIAKSTAHRLLTTLCSRGITERLETGHYRLGLHLYELGQLAQDREPLRHAALPLLEELRMATGLTVHLAIPVGADVVFIERLQTLRGMPLLGERQRRMPSHSTSAGKVLAAFDPDVALAREKAGFPRLTPVTIANVAEWRRALDAVRRTGIAVSDSENRPGLASVAAPVRDVGGRAIAAVSVAGPSSFVLDKVDRAGRVVSLTAAKLAARIGR
jgi:DNA-binding IclR family transcriptional regulator